MQENYITTESVLKLLGTHPRQNVIDFAIARLAMETDSVPVSYYGRYENTAALQPLVETLRGLSTEHRLELILLINTKNFSINQYGLSHNLIEFCKAVSCRTKKSFSFSLSCIS